MGDLESKSLDTPEEERAFPNGSVGNVSVGGTTIGRFTMQPGWRWSQSVKPIVNTDTCQNHHQGVAVGGQMHIVADDGSEIDIGPGDAYNIPPGHDAWVLCQFPYR